MCETVTLKVERGPTGLMSLDSSLLKLHTDVILCLHFIAEAQYLCFAHVKMKLAF